MVVAVDEEISRAEAPNPPQAAPEAAAAPRPEETQGMRLEREKPVTLQQLGRACDSWDNHSAKEDSSGSNVGDMRNRLKTLGSQVWGTKAQM